MILRTDCSTAEIPQYRLPFEVVSFELQLVKDLGVKVEFDKELGKHFTLQSLKDEGYKAVFVGIGKSLSITTTFNT